MIERELVSTHAERQAYETDKDNKRFLRARSAQVSSVTYQPPDQLPSSADFEALANGLPHLAWMALPDGSIYWFNDKWYEYTGTTFEEAGGWGWQSVHHPDHLASVLERWEAAVVSAEPVELIFPLRGADGHYRPFLTRAFPIKDKDGKIARWIGTNTDISEQQIANETLKEEKYNLEVLNKTISRVSEELNLANLVQTVTDAGVALTGAQFGAFFYNTTDVKGDSLTLYTISGVPREHFSAFPNPRATAVFAPTFRGEGPVRSDDILADPRYGRNEPRKGMPEGHLPVRSYLAVSVRSRTGEVLGGLFFGHPDVKQFSARHEELVLGLAGQAAIGIDNARLFDAAQREIAERRAAEKHRELLINELNHRVKNTLATVQSVTAQTLRSSPLGQEIRERLDARLVALSEAHNLLTTYNWEGATLTEVVYMALRPYQSEAHDPFSIKGPEVLLPTKTALAFAMALHELITNGIKYGSLSTAAGFVSIRWTVTGQLGAQRITFVWEEFGGPTVTPPTRRGFGTRLIERGLAADLGGVVRLEFPVTGVVCMIDSPLPKGASRD